jgi:lysozyme
MGDPGLYGPDDRPQAVSDLQRHPQQVNRIQVAALSLSATALVGLATHEGYVEKAYQDIVGVWTIGFGSTVKEDGKAVAPGDKTTPVAALHRTLNHVQKDETEIRKCVTAPLYQHEYDVMVDFAYQYGSSRLCRSSMVRLANQGRYEESCNAYLLYKYAGGIDCSVPGNRSCPGIWRRQLERQSKCLGNSKTQ